MMQTATRIYDRTIVAVFKENRKALRDLVRESEDIYRDSRKLRSGLMPTLRRLKGAGLELSLYYIQMVDYLSEIAEALVHITRPTFEHIDNNHEGLSREQATDLMHINDDVAEIYGSINRILVTNDFSEIDSVLSMREDLFERIAATTKSELVRINEGEGNTKASILYLTILSETRTMVLQARNLLKAQRYFSEHADARMGACDIPAIHNEVRNRYGRGRGEAAARATRRVAKIHTRQRTALRCYLRRLAPSVRPPQPPKIDLSTIHVRQQNAVRRTVRAAASTRGGPLLFANAHM